MLLIYLILLLFNNPIQTKHIDKARSTATWWLFQTDNIVGQRTMSTRAIFCNDFLVIKIRALIVMVSNIPILNNYKTVYLLFNEPFWPLNSHR